MSSPNPDSVLLRQYAARHDADAFAELVRLYGGLVFATARRITGNDHDAEDVTQQCFLELARRAGTLSGSVVAWLYRLACSRSLNFRRDRVTRQSYEEKAPPRQPEPLVEPTWAELEPVIDKAIESLPEDQRLPLILHYFQQKSQAEVARDTGMDQSTVSRKLTQAIQALRSQLNDAGVVVTEVTLSTSLLTHQPQAVPPSLAASLTKVGLIGVGKVSAGVTSVSIAVAGFFVLAIIVGGVLLAMKHDSQHPAPAPPSVNAVPAASPTSNVVTVRDTAGHPISHVRIAASFDDLYRGFETDASGSFPASRLVQGGQRYFAYSQRSGKLAVFTISPGVNDPSPPIVLNLNEGSADGCVVDSHGTAVAGTIVRIFVTMPDNQDFLWAMSQKTDDSGYYSVGPIPSAAGVKVRASLWDDPASADTTPRIDTNSLPQIEFPNLVDRNAPPSPHPGPTRIRYSGRIVDETGAPISGVLVSMSFPFRHMVDEAGIATTDSDGRFSRLLPPGANQVSFELLHPEHISFHFAGAAADTAALRDGSAVIVMKKGLPITGTVCDRSGKPVFNALVLAGRLYSSTGGTDTEPIEDCTAARTDAQGRFRIGGLPPGKNRVIASADQLAPTISPFNLTPDSQPLRIVLDPGATLSGTVVDAAGHPQSGVAVGCNQWNVEDSTPLARSTKTDVAGRFKLEHLPQQGELSILVDRKGFLGTSFSWSADKPTSPTIPLYKPPVVTGFVQDADTDAPIPRFDVMPGIYWNSHSEFDPLDFDGTDHVKSAGGRFSKRIQNIDVSLDLPRVAVRIVADGYLPQISPAVTPGKPYEPFVIHLKKAASITGKACLGDGQPVDGATVFLVEPQNTAFVQGLSVDEDTVASPQIHGTTDPAGNFKLSAADPSSRVLVLHSIGYAIVSAASLTASSSIALTPWARVSGVLHIAGKPINGKVLWLAPSPIPPRRSPAAIVFQLQATTRIDGSFEFDDVPAMNWTLSPAADRDGTTLSPRPVQTKPGQTLQVDLVDGNTAATSQP